jgi:hypothetical protein
VREHAQETHWRPVGRHRLDFRARAHHERGGRLGVVLVDRVCRRLLDGISHESGSLRGGLYRLDAASLGERGLGVAVCRKAAAAPSGGVRSLCDSSGVARPS